MLSTDLNSTQYPPTQIYLLEQSFNPASIPSNPQTILPNFSEQFKFESLDMLSLPALMSPSSSVNEFSESVDEREEEEEDDDEDLDEYEIFATPRQRATASNSNNSIDSNNNKRHYQLDCSEEKTMGFENAFSSSQQSFYNHSHFALLNISDSTYSDVQQPQLMYSQQPQQQYQQTNSLMSEAQLFHTLPLPQQYNQQQPIYPSNFIQHQQAFIPSSAPLDLAAPTIAVEQVANHHNYVDSRILDVYQQPSLLTTFENSVDLLKAPHMTNGGNVGGMPSNGPFTQSPTMSWASIESSRPASPEQQVIPSQVLAYTTGANSNKRPRPVKKHSASLYRKAKYHGSERYAAGANDVMAEEHRVASSTVIETDGSTRSKRKRRARQTKPKPKPTSFSCDVPDCGKVFSRAYNLTSHMKTHSAERPFLCGSCPLAFARRHDRERHVRLHTGEKPYSCQNCGGGFMRNDALHRHQRICGQSLSSLVALLQQNGGSQDSACSESLDTSSVYQNIFEL
ncbi:hypothetical protein EC991_011203 [Linnemannia zychae]|nr:hypothetical protein EC991_011203 [Linnemannia zychae]